MSMRATARRLGSRVADDIALSFDALTRPLRGPRPGLRTGHFQICHTRHEHDRVYAENVGEYFRQIGVACKVFEFEAPGRWPGLRRCLTADTIGVLGINAELDHCWIGSKDFLTGAALRGVPVIHWILDHPSARWQQFTHATAANSRFLFVSDFAADYFRRYCLPSARLAATASVGANWRSRIPTLSREEFLTRQTTCLIPLGLKRIGGTIADVRERLARVDPGLQIALREAIERARHDLEGPLEAHLVAALARSGRELHGSEFHRCFQIVDDTVQIERRSQIFAVAARFPVAIQTDVAPPVSNSVARISTDAQTISMTATIERMKSCRAVLSANYANDLFHDRTQNGLNAGCAAIVEDTPVHRRLFTHGKNALLFRYHDDSLAECLDLVCDHPQRAYEIAQAGFALRDDPAVRFGGFDNILKLARA
ncbi:MAG: glycosyltransferase family 1 protein [Hyphomicrobiales bacterium]|nr:glycosyltransferase family 1 protein [Hyphomicrobiales bacterium]MBV9427621.1 glycosyltransferase family 1 protein [Bradyrhizobiaceae bacterium]